MADCSSKTVLVLQLARLGDFLQTTPFLAALKSCQYRRLQVLVQPPQARLAWASGLVDEVHVLNPRDLETAINSHDPWPLKAARLGGLLGWLENIKPDTAYNLNFSQLAALAMARSRPAFVRGWRLDNERMAGEDWMSFIMAMAGQRKLSRMHLSDILASYADPALPPLQRLAYQVDEKGVLEARALLTKACSPLVGLQLGANHRLRRWPTSSFAALAEKLLAQGVNIALLGSQAEQGLADKFMRHLDSPRILNLVGRTGLNNLAAVLARLDLLVSSDTGTLHLATAVGATCLALYMGPAQVHETGPYSSTCLTLQASMPCAPCVEANPPCSGQALCRYLLTPDMAYKAVLALLQKESLEQAVAGLPANAEVCAFAGKWDSFGLYYHALDNRELSAENALALSLREMGRVIARSRYQMDARQTRRELASYAPPTTRAKEQMAEMLRQMHSLKQNGGQAGSIHDSLRALQGLSVHAPARLGAGWQAAMETMELAREL